MIKLTDAQITSLKSTKICFSYAESVETWIDKGIVAVPTRETYAEDYASYFTRSEFYTIGSFSYSWSAFPEMVSIGRYCSIAHNVEIIPGSHPTDLFTTSSMVYDPWISHRRNYYRDLGYPDADIIHKMHPIDSKDIIIGHDVYIGIGVKLRRGITIGNGAIVGAHSVVTKDVAPYSVVAGNPAKVVRWRFGEKQIEALNQIEWWNYDFRTIFHKTHISDANLLIDRLHYLIGAGEISKFVPKRHYIKHLLS